VRNQLLMKTEAIKRRQ